MNLEKASIKTGSYNEATYSHEGLGAETNPEDICKMMGGRTE